MNDYRSIVKDAAKRKLVDLTKAFLEIIDELKKEDGEKLKNFSSISSKWMNSEEVEVLMPFLALMTDCKKDILRKRILDKAGELSRELDN